MKNSKENFYIVLMAGGSGTRLWPISRTNLPKQFHKFASNKSLLQETYNRIKDLVPKQNIYVSLMKSIEARTQKELPEIPKSNYIIEPEPKNTGPAIGLVANLLFKINPEAIIATISSDHTVGKVSCFQRTLLKTFDFVKENPEFLSTIGIEPTRPNTGFGYIKKGSKFPDSEFYRVKKFVEKPNLEVAKKYLRSGNYYWNASYFTFSAARMLKLYEKFAPEIYSKLRTDLYIQMPKIAFDNAIAEKTDKIAVIPADLDWSDIGTWASVYETLAKRSNHHTVSIGHHIGIDDKNVLVYAQERLLATIGLENIVIIDTPDVTLVCNAEKTQEVKRLLEKLKEQRHEKYL